MQFEEIRRSLSILAVGSLLALATSADAALQGPSESSVGFTAIGPGGLKIEGKTTDLKVSESAGKVHFVVPLGNVDTGIGVRNKHMREKYLEVDKFPNAELVVDRAALKLAADGQETSGTVAGTLTIHGQAKPANLTYSARHQGSSYKFSGSMHINMKDFNIEVPSYLGVSVKPDVDVTVRGAVDDK